MVPKLLCHGPDLLARRGCHILRKRRLAEHKRDGGHRETAGAGNIEQRDMSGFSLGHFPLPAVLPPWVSTQGAAAQRYSATAARSATCLGNSCGPEPTDGQIFPLIPHALGGCCRGRLPPLRRPMPRNRNPKEKPQPADFSLDRRKIFSYICMFTIQTFECQQFDGDGHDDLECG